MIFFEKCELPFSKCPTKNYIGGSNYDSLFVRTVAFPVQVAYWNQRGHSPLRIQCPMSNLTSGPETWPWGPVGW